MSIILLNGIIGHGINSELKTVEAFGDYIGSPVKVYDVVKLGKKELGVPDSAMLFGPANTDLFRKVRKSGYQQVGHLISSASVENAIIRTDASLFWDGRITENPDSDLIRRHIPSLDLVVTMIEASQEIVAEFSGQEGKPTNRYSRLFKGQNLTERQVLQWQDVEISNSKDWVSDISRFRFSDGGHAVRHFTLAVGEPFINLYKAATIRGIRRAYYTYAMTDATPELIRFRDELIEKLTEVQLLASDPKTIEIKLSTGSDQVAVASYCVTRDLYDYTKESDILIAIFPDKAASPGHWAEVNYGRLNQGIPVLRFSKRPYFSPFEVPYGSDYLVSNEPDMFSLLESLGIHRVDFDYSKYREFCRLYRTQ